MTPKRLLVGLLLASLPAVHQTQAAPLTLACSGTMTTVLVKNLTPDGPVRNNLSAFSVVIDLDKRAVSGFWIGPNNVHDNIPITAADANSITFMEERKEMRILGTVDRVTGEIVAQESLDMLAGESMQTKWLLECKPTKPLF